MSRDHSAPILHFPQSLCKEEVVFVVGEGERLRSSDSMNARQRTTSCDPSKGYAEINKSFVQESTGVHDDNNEPLVDVNISLPRYYCDRSMHYSTMGVPRSDPKHPLAAPLRSFKSTFQKNRDFLFTFISTIHDLSNL